MKKVILTQGLPGSGKTTWAKKMLEDHPGQYKRINKDDLRAMLDAGKWSSDNEKLILKVRDMLILQAIEAGKNVIVDDTNLHKKHEQQIKELVKDKAEVLIQDFTQVSIETCIKQDLNRINSVGEKVITGMYKQFLAPKKQIVEWIEGLPTAIICDIDGTIALFGDANPYDRDFSNDDLNEPVAKIIELLPHTITPIFVSGRKDTYKRVTEDWLVKKLIDRIPNLSYHFFMRKADDNRKDFVVKKEIFDQNIRGIYNVLFVLDDRNQVVEMWRSLGLTCLQVADGNF